MLKKLLVLLLALLMLCTAALGEILTDGDVVLTEDLMIEYGYDYSSPDEVALYLHVFCELPPNYLTKDEARDLGWDSRKGNLWDIAYGLSIGGDTFGNREGLLPDGQYYGCDVNYEGGFRGGERLVFSEEGQIYYTADHYESFDLLYDGWYEGETITDDFMDFEAEEYGYSYGDESYGSDAEEYGWYPAEGEGTAEEYGWGDH